MGMLTNVLLGIAGVVSLICFILVLVQMFRRGQTGLGIVCIILAFCVGLGGLIAFIVGWVRAREWGITNIMIAWTVAWIVGLAAGGIQYTMAPPGQPVVPLGQPALPAR